MIESVERRFGLAGRLPVEIEWLSHNGSPYTARETVPVRDYRPVSCTIPFESPQSNHRTAWRKAEAFVKTFKRDYDRVNPLPDAVRVLAPTRQLVRALQRRPSDPKCGRRCASTA